MSEELSLKEIRLQKLEKLRDLGCDPYLQEKHPCDYPVTRLKADFEALAPASDANEDERAAKALRLTGRILGIRIMGKAAFADISDGDARIQGYFRLNDLGPQLWEAFQLLDVGDHIGVTGYLFLTKAGERSIYVQNFTPLSKCLHTLPLAKEKGDERWYGLEDIELRYRHRHLDLICNPDERQLLLNRCRVVAGVRKYFTSAGFLEVETPVLQVEAGGAAARPFHSYYNAYKTDVKLRISLELYLKRILCGDVPRIFEIGRVFRNEGVSTRHSPEFTLLEWYEAYVNLEDTQKRVEEVFRAVCQEVFGTTKVTIGDYEIDFGPDWQRVDMLEAITARSGVTAEELSTFESARDALARLGHDVSKARNLGWVLEKLLESYVEPHLVQPTFVVGYPLESSPLAKKDPNRPGFTRRCEGYILGREVCNMFSEINDPMDQRERFEQQVHEKEAGDEEAHPMDEDFLYALECGMPPAGGCGIGMDRMAMLLGGSESIKEVLFFPMMRPDDYTAENSDES